MFKRFAAVLIKSTQPRAPHAAVNQVGKLRLGSIDKLAAWLGHGLSLGMLEYDQHQTALKLDSDLSESIKCANTAFRSGLG